MDDLNKALNYLFGFKVPIDDYDEFEKKVEEARELKEHLDKVELLKDIPQIITPVKMTNYDRIKSMSVEDLTKFISNITKVVAVKLGEDYVVNDKQFIQQWLLQEVSDEK